MRVLNKSMNDAKNSQFPEGSKMHRLASELFPICRSLTGDGVRQTLSILKREFPEIQIQEVPSGTSCFDWEVPEEWNIRDAFIEDASGKKVVDFKNSNLHVVGYSEPVDQMMDLNELNERLFSLPEQPEAIPYLTSYYKKFWGFCIQHSKRLQLKPGKYRVKIDSSIKRGSMTYADCLIPGKTSEEILLSTYICHPSMANNELSGPVLAVQLAKLITSLKNRHYSYRIVFVPETIGAVMYLSKHLGLLQKNVKAGFQLTCVGDDRAYSYLPSRMGGTLADRAALHVLAKKAPKFVQYDYLDRGSDERQYCSPGVDLPLCSVMRSKYHVYPEYHTSLDNLEFISASGLQGAFDIYTGIIRLLEANRFYRVTTFCEPQLGKRGLYPNMSSKTSISNDVKLMMDFIAYADGKTDLISIAERLGCYFEDLVPVAEKLTQAGLFEVTH